MAILASLPLQKMDSTPTNCRVGPSCDCSSKPKTVRHFSWPATLALMAAGTVPCLLIVKLFGV